MKLALKTENLAQLVYFTHGEKVMVDADLARLYGVSTKALNQALRRNRERFPDDFVFQLTAEEFAFLRSQIVISNARRALFTEASSELVTVCDQFTQASRRTLPSLRVYRAGRCHAVECLALQARCGSQHRYHAHVRPVAADS